MMLISVIVAIGKAQEKKIRAVLWNMVYHMNTIETLGICGYDCEEHEFDYDRENGFSSWML